MIIFLYGEDSYRARQKLNEIIDKYKETHKSGLNLKYLDFSKGESENVVFSDLKNELRQTSMFKEKKLQIIINPFLNIGFKGEFLKEPEDFINSQNVILLFQDNKIDERDSLFKFLKKYAKCQEFKFLEVPKLKNWIKKEFDSYDAKINTEVINKLIEYVGDDLWRMSNEIKKLVSFKKGNIIKTEDIDLLVRSKIDTYIFKTIDAISQKDKKQALKLLHEHLEKGDSPLYLLSMIGFQFRNLLIVQDLIERRNTYDAILKKSGLHPFVVKKSYFQAREFTINELKKIYQKIFQADLDIKTGRVEPEAALDLLVAGI